MCTKHQELGRERCHVVRSVVVFSNDIREERRPLRVGPFKVLGSQTDFDHTVDSLVASVRFGMVRGRCDVLNTVLCAEGGEALPEIGAVVREDRLRPTNDCCKLFENSDHALSRIRRRWIGPDISTMVVYYRVVSDTSHCDAVDAPELIRGKRGGHQLVFAISGVVRGLDKLARRAGLDEGPNLVEEILGKTAK